MKKKKLLPVILTFALLFTGCGTAKPASVVESAIKCLQENKLDEATVTVNVTYKDAGAVTKLAYQDLIKQSVSSALTTSLAGAGGDIDESDISAMFIKSFENAQDSAAFVDKSDELKISCKKIDGKWKISDSTDLLNVYYGNILNTLDKLTSDDSDSDDDNKADTEADTEVDTSKQETDGTEPFEAESDSAAMSLHMILRLQHPIPRGMIQVKSLLI